MRTAIEVQWFDNGKPISKTLHLCDPGKYIEQVQETYPCLTGCNSGRVEVNKCEAEKVFKNGMIRKK